ncbi:MAG TPA: DUF692 domain-containing protein [Candidatus Obscuribacterales bacterium]
MSNFLNQKKSLPYLGVGLGLRRELAGETLSTRDRIDWLELVPENYMGLGGAARDRLDRAISAFPLVTHGINLSIGSTDDLNNDYLKALKRLLAQTKAPWFSDHLCFTSFDGKYMHDLLPMPRTREAVRHVAARCKRVQDEMGIPFLLENISYYMEVPGSELGDADFLSEVLEAADCGLLLDVNNVYVNSLNHNFNPYDYLSKIPLERTVQIHVAGHKRGHEFVIDTHGAPVVEPVYELLQFVLERVDVKAVMIERDQNYPQFSELLDELDRIREIALGASPKLLPGVNVEAFREKMAARKQRPRLAEKYTHDMGEAKHARVLSA